MFSFIKQNIGWFFTFLSLVGNVFVIKKNIWGQIIWSISNVGWISYFYSKGEYPSVFLFSVYFILYIWGVLEWKKEKQ